MGCNISATYMFLFRIFALMCGIAGIISADPAQLSEECLNKMALTLSHRGPDSENIWINANGNAGFSHRRLSIIDLSSTANQPMHYQNRYTIVYNGEIYNYIELKNNLQTQGYTFRSKSDTEVILAMYSKYKYDCLKYFDGMFAFAIWDEVEQTLFAARDRFGEKPFFYHWNENLNTFYFASEMKALWTGGVEKKIDDKMFFQYISLGYTQNPSDAAATFFSWIKKIPPRSYLLYKFSTKKITVSSYWDIDLNKKQSIKEGDAIQKLKEIFTTSVSRRLRSDVPLGTSLSGGLDSSGIVAAISEIYKKANTNNDLFSTFSAVFNGYEKDESKYINIVAEKFNVQNFKVTPTVDGLIADLENLSWHQEEPFSSSTYAHYKVMQLAAQQGIKVLLDGQGADETMAGYAKYYHWYWQELLMTKGINAMNKEKKNTVLPANGFSWGYKNYFAAFMPGLVPQALINKALRTQKKQPDISEDYFNANFDKYFLKKPVVKRLEDLLYFNIFKVGLEDLLRLADRNSMAFGREIRLPFLNHELVEFIFSLPSNFKIQNGFTKWILRKTMEHNLPKEIVWRKDKIAFEPPQKVWMQDKKLQEYIHESKKKLISKGVLNAAALQKKVIPSNAYDAENSDWIYLSAAQML